MIGADWMFDTLRKSWVGLSNFAIWVCSIIATFVVVPSFLDDTWVHLSHFIVGVLTGFLLLLGATLKSRRRFSAWVAMAITFFLFGLITFFVGDDLTIRWSVNYPPNTLERVLVGKSYTDFAQSAREHFRRDNGHFPSDQELVWQNAGPDNLWPPGEIAFRHQWAAIVYILNVSLPACCIIALTRAIGSRK
jgi:hypothetical protein